jgi:hypothetical protein
MKKFHIWNSFERKDGEIIRYQPPYCFFSSSCSRVQDQDLTKYTLTGREIVTTPHPARLLALFKLMEHGTMSGNNGGFNAIPVAVEKGIELN